MDMCGPVLTLTQGKPHLLGLHLAGQGSEAHNVTEEDGDTVIGLGLYRAPFPQRCRHLGRQDLVPQGAFRQVLGSQCLISGALEVLRSKLCQPLLDGGEVRSLCCILQQVAFIAARLKCPCWRPQRSERCIDACAPQRHALQVL